MATPSPTTNTTQKKPWRKKLTWIVGLVILVPGAFYIYFFIRVAPPRFVEVVDAITGRPLANMNVCMQLVANEWGDKQALRSELSTTDSKGKIFFWPSIHNLSLFDQWGGYSIQVSDPKSSFAPRCGPQVGLTYPQLDDQLSSSRADGTEYFPVELVEQVVPTQPQTWTLIRRVGSSGVNLQVELIPIFQDADKCGEPVSQLSRDCRQLASRTEAAVVQRLVPMYFAGMERTTIQRLDSESSSSDRTRYTAVYARRSTPPEYLSVQIEEFPDSGSASQHIADFLHATSDYDPSVATQEEIFPGQIIRWVKKSQTDGAFWISDKSLVFVSLTASTPSRKRELVIEWLHQHPSTMGISVP